MANRYVNSAATGANDGTSWANAFTTLAGAAAVDTAGDTIWVKSTHSESTAGAVSLLWAGTTASPTRILCVSDANEPPTTLATGASVATTGANALSLTGNIYVYGITFSAGGGGSNNTTLTLGGGSSTWQVYASCTFTLATTHSSATIQLSGTNSGVDVYNCTFSFASTSQRLYFATCRGEFYGCTFGTSALTVLISTFSDKHPIPTFNACDFSALASTLVLSAVGFACRFRNCKMPASWSGSVSNTAPMPGQIHEMYNCDSADTQYRLERKTKFGAVTHDTSIYRTAGASNGTTHISWKMVSNTDSEWLHQTLDSPEITIWNETTGSAVTVTVEFLIDSATTLYTGDVWMEVMYLGTSGVPLGSIDTDSRLSNYLAANTTECTTGTGTGNWTGKSGSAKSYKMVSTITPQEKGVIHAVVKLAKESTTIYVDPMITVA